MQRLLAFIATLLLAVTRLSAAPVPLFDGKTFTGWEGDTANRWRIEDGGLAAGSLERRLAKSDFLVTTKEFANFELTLQWKVEGKHVNGGAQFRSLRGADSHEVSGYQADLGAGHDGELYDESRRKKLLAGPSKEVMAKASRPQGEWNDYRIRAEGPRIQIWLNGVQTVDYTESDASIASSGIVALQIHGSGPSIVRYKDIAIEELKWSAPGKPRRESSVRNERSMPQNRTEDSADHCLPC